MSEHQKVVLTIPGQFGSSENHWQTYWERHYRMTRVEQHDWIRPLRGDWIARLEDVVLAQSFPCVLVAHGLGCILVASWAAYSKNTSKIKAALLVAPVDVDAMAASISLHSWANIPSNVLPFKSSVVASANDSACSFDKAQKLANDWGAHFINAEPDCTSWPEGYQMLIKLIENKEESNGNEEA